MSHLWERVLEGWNSSAASLSRLPTGAWPIVVGALARRAREGGRTTLVLVRHPDRFLAELRPWLAGRPASYLFAEVAISFLDRPPAVDPAVGRRLEALAALAPGGEPSLIVSSRRATMRPLSRPRCSRRP